MTVKRTFQVGDRVQISSTHRWKPGRVGAIIEIHDRTGSRYVVRFDRPELGFYSEHKDKSEPRLLRLGEFDLELIDEKKK